MISNAFISSHSLSFASGFFFFSIFKSGCWESLGSEIVDVGCSMLIIIYVIVLVPFFWEKNCGSEKFTILSRNNHSIEVTVRSYGWTNFLLFSSETCIFHSCSWFPIFPYSDTKLISTLKIVWVCSYVSVMSVNSQFYRWVLRVAHAVICCIETFNISFIFFLNMNNFVNNENEKFFTIKYLCRIYIIKKRSSARWWKMFWNEHIELFSKSLKLNAHTNGNQFWHVIKMMGNFLLGIRTILVSSEANISAAATTSFYWNCEFQRVRRRTVSKVVHRVLRFAIFYTFWPIHFSFSRNTEPLSSSSSSSEFAIIIIFHDSGYLWTSMRSIYSIDVRKKTGGKTFFPQNIYTRESRDFRLKLNTHETEETWKWIFWWCAAHCKEMFRLFSHSLIWKRKKTTE